MKTIYLSIATCLLSASVFLCNSVLANELTNSQKILAKVMDDIRRCDKSTRYEYDSGKKQINPTELTKIKGFKLAHLYRDVLAVFSIDEIYKGLHAKEITVSLKGVNYAMPFQAIGFAENFEKVRQRFEEVWEIKLTDGFQYSSNFIHDGKHAEIRVVVDMEDRVLSVEKIPKKYKAFTSMTSIGCNGFDLFE